MIEHLQATLGKKFRPCPLLVLVIDGSSKALHNSFVEVHADENTGSHLLVGPKLRHAR